MFFDIHELELRKMPFAETLAPGRIDFGPEVIQVDGLKTSGQAELIEEHHGGKKVVKDIRVVGKYATRVGVHCARCLEPVELPLAAGFDLLYRPAATLEAADDVAIHEADAEVGFFQGQGLPLVDVLREQVLLAVPLRALCREDCKGLCPHCGMNWNTGSCQCVEHRTDPRWDALAGLRDKLKDH
ncbi:MAG: DUF177 domain-containing protein [Acidobacteriales bacterium]|nr:DUF177 domain-containing protein [Terriglobales bacterium]